MTESTRVWCVRASFAEREVWGRAAAEAGLSFNAWARRALKEAAELEASIALEGEGESALSRPV